MAKLASFELMTSSLVLILSWIFADAALACSWVNDATAKAQSVAISNYYWIATGLLGCLVIFIELRRKSLSVILIFASLLIVLHPAWTIQPNYGPDCAFQNVEASQVDILIVGVLLAYQLVRYLWELRELR